jgi:AcrR family transcriptional regulator
MMAYGPRLVRASSQRKLDALLAKAAVLIAKQGFEATSMRDLSAAMNGSLAGLYHYFTSKEDLLFQLQHRTFLGLLAAQQDVAARPGTPEERLDRLIKGHLRYYSKHTNELKACTFELESLTGEALDAVEAIRRQYYRLMTSAVAAVMDGAAGKTKASRRSRHATLFIFGMLNWIFTWYDPSRHGTMESIGREMRDLVLDGLRRTK